MAAQSTKQSFSPSFPPSYVRRTQQASFHSHHLHQSKTNSKNMAGAASGSNIGQREGAEMVYGGEECYRHSVELLQELGFPKGVLPLKDLVECGRVRETGFVWMKLKAPYEHFFEATNTRVSYAAEVTAYVEKLKMKKMSGIKSKQMFLWVPISEMSMEDASSKKITFKTPMGIGKSFPVSAFMTSDDDDDGEVAVVENLDSKTEAAIQLQG